MANLDNLAKNLGGYVYEISSETIESRPKRVRKSVKPKITEWNTKKNGNYSRDFELNVESEQWNKYYSDRNLSSTPFYGLSTRGSAVSLFKILNQPKFQLLVDDIIVEVGHGKHPMVDEIRKIFKINNIFIGIEFSPMAIKEAIANRTIKDLKDTQFVMPSNINYYSINGDFDGHVVHSTIGNECLLKKCCAKLIVGRCVLDYITSRLLTSIGSVNWDDDPRVPNSVIAMFNSFTNTLLESVNGNNNAAIVFIEPFDKIKVRDHILTLFKVLCVSSLVEKSDCRYLKLHKIITKDKMGIICYMMIKTQISAENFEEIHDNFTNVTDKILKLDKSQDPDWLLPMKMPSKWSSGEKELFDVLTSFSTGV